MGYSDERYTITKRKTPENYKREEEMSGFETLAFGLLGAIALGQYIASLRHNQASYTSKPLSDMQKTNNVGWGSWK